MKEIEINKIPSPTWSWLKINESKALIPETFEEIRPEIRGNSEISAFSSKNLSEDIKSFTDSKNFSSKEEEAFKSLSLSDAFSNLFSSTKALSIEACQKNQKLVVEYKLDKGNYSASQLIRAKEGSQLSLTILSENNKDLSEAGFFCQETLVLAEANSQVTINKIHLLNDNFTQICSTKVFAEENASVTVNHILLGAKASFMESKCALSGYKSSFNSELSYMAEKEEYKDINYVVNHYGKKTECNMNVYGTLRDKAVKDYRGTIDFKTGSSSSVGQETEDALLLSPLVKNNSLPVILCTEEDVEGEHGATIGRISEDTLYYMQSRGFSKKQAENACARAKIQRVLSKIDDEEIYQKISDFMTTIFDEE